MSFNASRSLPSSSSCCSPPSYAPGPTIARPETPFQYRAFHQIRVIDGDTIAFAFDLGFNSTSVTARTRLYRTDTPELRSRQQRAAARVAKAVTMNWMADNFHHMVVHSFDQGKYAGRYIGDIYSWRSEQWLSDHLVAVGVAKHRPKNTTRRYAWTPKQLASMVRKAEKLSAAYLLDLSYNAVRDGGHVLEPSSV